MARVPIPIIPKKNLRLQRLDARHIDSIRDLIAPRVQGAQGAFARIVGERGSFLPSQEGPDPRVAGEKTRPPRKQETAEEKRRRREVERERQRRAARERREEEEREEARRKEEERLKNEYKNKVYQLNGASNKKKLQIIEEMKKIKKRLKDIEKERQKYPEPEDYVGGYIGVPAPPEIPWGPVLPLVSNIDPLPSDNPTGGRLPDEIKTIQISRPGSYVYDPEPDDDYAGRRSEQGVRPLRIDLAPIPIEWFF